MPLSSQEPNQMPEVNALPVGRRKVMGMMGLAGLGLVASASNADAFVFGGSSAPKVTVASSSGSQRSFGIGTSSGGVDLSDLPPEWLQSQGAAVPEYARYLASLKFKNLTAKQVLEAHAKERGGVWNNLPPKQWWTRMGYTLRVVDRIAVELNSPVAEIVSAYRCPRYNARCEGAKIGSWHQANVAVDVKFPMSAYKVTATARNLRDRGLFKGGVGSYPGFTHVDTRGVNINW
ncbi:MAG: D-Ala-D-Ala carboxypeptidase family metallohydrolase [Luteolibacter sp.]